MNGAFVDDFDSLVYAPAHPGTLNFLGGQVTNLVQNWSQGFTAAAAGYVDTAKQLYNSVYSDEAMRLSRAALRKVKHIFQRDEIRSLWDIGSIQQASLKMQRWIMANPTIREAYHQQLTDGYSGTYIDMYPGQIGREHIDYRRVMEGMVQEEGDDLKIVHYFDPEDENEPKLTHENKDDIISTWSAAIALLKAGREDPFSVYNNKL